MYINIKKTKLAQACIKIRSACRELHLARELHVAREPHVAHEPHVVYVNTHCGPRGIFRKLNGFFFVFIS